MDRFVTGTSLLTHWYFHLPNFILAALMYTLLGRALLGLIVQPDSGNYIWRFFCHITDPVVAAVALVTPKAAAPVIIWLFGVVWLFWLRVAMLYVFLVLGAVPKVELRNAMPRHWYFIGIAFFGMINGLVQPACAAVRADPRANTVAGAVVRKRAADLMFSSLMVSTATIILGGIPAATLRTVCRRQGRLDRGIAVDLARRHSAADVARDGQFLYLRALAGATRSGCAATPPPGDG